MFKEWIDASRLTRDELQLMETLAARHDKNVDFTAIVRDSVNSGTFNELFSDKDQQRFKAAIDNINARNNNHLHITEYTTDESGKMINTPALGTTSSACNSCLENIRRAIASCDFTNPCLWCYSQLGTHYNFDQAYLILNHDMLQEVIEDDELTYTAKQLLKVCTKSRTIAGVKYSASMQIRIQHKGDVDSIIESRNYARLAEIVHSINSEVSVTAWTKFPETYAAAMNAFTDVDFSYLRIGYSARAMGAMGILEGIRYKQMFPFLKFVFIVYERDDDGRKEYTDDENSKYVNDNFKQMVEMYNGICLACRCAKGSCTNCGQCYGRGIDSDKLLFVFELKRG